MHRKLTESARRPIVLEHKTYKYCTMPSSGATVKHLTESIQFVCTIPFWALRNVNKSSQLVKVCLENAIVDIIMSSNIHVCIKVFRRNNQLPSTFQPEVLMSKLSHSNLPWLYGVLQHNGHKILVLSFHGVDGRSIYTLHSDGVLLSIVRSFY